MSIFDDLENYRPNVFNNTRSARDNTTESFIDTLRTRGFDISEMKPILETRGNQLVLSGAGSGKTTTLIFKVQYDILSGEATKTITLPNTQEPTRVVENILVSTFLKSGAEELKTRLSAWQRELGYNNSAESIKFKTLHAEFLDVLRTMGVGTQLITDKESRRITKAICDKYGIVNRRSNYMSIEDYYAIEGIFAYSRNRLDDKKYTHKDCEIYNITPQLLETMLYDTKVERRNINRIDFEDVQEILLMSLQSNPYVVELVRNKYKLLYIDEFQDTSQIQYEILKYYFLDAKKVFAVGDDDQSIYGWRGSDINIITRKFTNDYQVTISKLLVNYRCPSKILNPVINSIEKNTNRYDKQLRAYREGGSLQVNMCVDFNATMNTLGDSIREGVLGGKKMAILCRTNFDGLIPALYLETERLITYSVNSMSMTLDKKLPRDILDYVSIFTDRESPRLRKCLEMLLSRSHKYEVNSLMKVLRSNPRLSIWTIDPVDLRCSTEELAGVLDTFRGCYSVEHNEQKSLIRLYKYIKSEVYSGDNEYCRGAREFIDFLIYFIEKRNISNIDNFEIAIRELNKNIKANIGNKNALVTITTVHEAKGKEWETVIIWNDIQGVYPSDRCEESDIELYEEERRIHYIAWTRAKERLIVFSIYGLVGKFLQECDIPKDVFKNNFSGSLKK